MPHLKQHPVNALQLVEQLRTLIQSQPPHAGTVKEIADVKELAKELRKDREFTHTILLAVLNQYPVPVAIFKQWASYPVLNAAERAGQVALERRNGKVLITPEAFFAWFRSLPAQTKRTKRSRSSDPAKP